MNEAPKEISPDFKAILNGVNTAPATYDEQTKQALEHHIEIQAQEQVREFMEKAGLQADQEEIARKLLEIQKERSGGTVDKIVADLFRFVMVFAKDLFLIGQYASITGEKTRLRELRKDVRPSMLPVEMLIEAYRRDRSIRPDAENILQLQGYEDVDIKRLLDMVNFVANPEDVIRFAVREVYDESFAQRWKLDEGLSVIKGNALPDAEKAGISWELFTKYWRSHWTLPSPTQAYEMLHRGAIGEEDLRRILKANDYMPGFIDAFLKISYAPLTRVDVRRMYKLGVLTSKQEITKAYMDLGYDYKNAELLYDFTVEDAKPKDKDNTSEKELTRTDILSAYKYKLFTKSDTVEALGNIGYSEDEAGFYIERQNFLEYQERADVLVKTYRTGYLNGVYSKADIITKLGHLDLPSAYTDALIQLWDVEKEGKVERPTKSEVLGFLKSGIIDEGTAQNELSIMGYSAKYIEWYIKGVRSSHKTN